MRLLALRLIGVKIQPNKNRPYNHDESLGFVSIYNFHFQSEQDPCFSSFFSKLSCIHFGSWDGNKEWSVSMNENEDIEVCLPYSIQFVFISSLI